MKPFRWWPEKNEQLVLEHGISFEQMVVAIEAVGLLDVLAHPNPTKYPNQKVLVVASDGYAYLVPFIEQERSLLSQDRHPGPKGNARLHEPR